MILNEDWEACEGGNEPTCLHESHLFCWVWAIHVCPSSGLFLVHFLVCFISLALRLMWFGFSLPFPRDVMWCNDCRNVVVISEKTRKAIRDDFLARTRELVKRSCLSDEKMTKTHNSRPPFTRRWCGRQKETTGQTRWPPLFPRKLMERAEWSCACRS